MERTAYGERLYQARKHADLTQKELARRAGMSQSNLAELERSGQGSAKTAQLADATGVRVQWLADGREPMLAETKLPAAAEKIASEDVAHYLINKAPAGTDYRTIAVTLAAALEESGTTVTLQQFIKLVDLTHSKLSQ